MKRLTKDLLETRIHVKKARNLFIDVSNTRKQGYQDKTMYSILDYPRIAREMYEFIKGYIECKSTGAYKYKNTAVSTTVQFYNNMFKDPKYRRRIHLSDMDELMSGFLEYTNKLQSIMDEHLKELNVDAEMKTMFELTNNQYRKVAKVNRDDMEIFLWLVYKNEINGKSHGISGSLRAAYLNDSTPVMHEVKMNE